MMRFVLLLALAAVAVLGVVVGKERLPGRGTATALGRARAARRGRTRGGEPLYQAGPPPFVPPSQPAGPQVRTPLVLPDCRLSVCDKQDVPSQREGVLLVVGTEVEPGQN